MVRHDQLRHWCAYALALLPILLLEGFVFWRIPFPFSHPFLLPFALAMVSSREGIVGGAGYGLFVGLFAMLLGHGGSMLFLCCLVGAVVSLMFNLGLQQNIWGCFLGALAAALLLALLRVLTLSLFAGAFFFSMFPIALSEFLWSLPFFPLVYGSYSLPARRTSYPKGGLAL